jgi:excisionase family DNA binding protein
LVYSVDEVSERLDIPRPTLYRYLREYSIPHLRRAGKISIPEESFDRIREARELHREGLGTEAVRRRLREEDILDVEELAERLDRLSGALERLREDLKPINGTTGSQREALQTLHEKQDTLISEVSRLNKLVQELSSMESSFQREAFQQEPSDSPEGSREPEVIFQQSEERTERLPQAASSAETDPVRNSAVQGAVAEPASEMDGDPDPTTRMEGHDPSTRKVYSKKSGDPFVVFTLGERFGDLVKGRWRWLLALLVTALVLLMVAVLVWGLLAPGEGAKEQTSSNEPEAQEESQSASEASESPQAVEVPGLVGLTLPEAQEEIDMVGLEGDAVNEVSSYAVPAGTVAAQEPAVGVEVDPGSPVNLVVSSGPPESVSNAVGGTGSG